MNYLRLSTFFALLLLSAHVWSVEGTITTIGVGHIPNMESQPFGTIEMSLTSTPDPHPNGCTAAGLMIPDLSSPLGKALYATALSAKIHNQTVRVTMEQILIEVAPGVMAPACVANFISIISGGTSGQ